MTGRRLSLLTALLAVVIIAGCARTADSGGTSAGAPGPVPSVSADPSIAADPARSPTPPTSDPPPPSAAGALSISGEVTAGVEPNCLLLTGPDGEHLLVFDDESMRAKAKVGTRITVTGRAEPAMMSTCQQGIPFVVTSVRAA
jgi:hypothetical protein